MAEMEYTDITKYYVLVNPQLLDADLNAKTHAFLSVPHNIDHEKIYFDEHLRQFCNTGLLICTESALNYPEIEFSYKGSKKLKVIELDDQEHAAILLTMKCINSFTPIFMELREYKMKNGSIILPDIVENKPIENVTFRALDKKKNLDTPVLTALLTINNSNFEIGSVTDRFITVTDNLYELNPHGKVTIEQYTRAFNANSSKSGVGDVSVDEMREMIGIYRESYCIITRGDEILHTIDNHLVDITRETETLRINNKLVNEYYHIHRPSLIKQISQAHPGVVNYIKIPFNWLDMGFRATPANNALIFYISKAIAMRLNEIDMDAIYRIAKATTPKQQLDTRRKIEKLLDSHRYGKVKTALEDYVVLDQYGEQIGVKGLKDPDAKMIELQYDGE